MKRGGSVNDKKERERGKEMVKECGVGAWGSLSGGVKVSDAQARPEDRSPPAFRGETNSRRDTLGSEIDQQKKKRVTRERF